MSNLLTVDASALAEQFRALGNPHRLEIFLYLARNCAPETVISEEAATACVGDLASMLALAPSTVSHHLKELRQAGLIRMSRRGQSVDCWVERETLERLSDFFADAARCGAPGR